MSGRDAVLVPDAAVPVVSRRLLDAAVVNRERSFLAADLEVHQDRLAAALAGRRVLIVGGGGSIGGMTTRLLLKYGPAAVHVIDQNENYLADLVRDIRSGPTSAAGIDLRLWPIDFGGPIAEQLIRTEAPYDLVLNFAALKHVRSEKDRYSLLQMLDTNIVRQARFKEWVVARGGTSRYFGVSTDKAANPTSLMGATKRLMEDVLFGTAPSSGMTVCSARFANVAFSNGSLLQAWLRRLELGQPLAVPRDTRRYFVTQAESGEICLLAALLGSAEEILIPRLNPAKQLVSLDSLARRILALHGFEAVAFEDEEEARQATGRLRTAGQWPLLLTPLDTSGEKPYEEFVGWGEVARDVGLTGLLAVRHAVADVRDVVARLATLLSGGAAHAAKADLVAVIAAAIPGFRHVETGKSLDGRM